MIFLFLSKYGVKRYQEIIKNEFIIFIQPLRSGKIWHEVNFFFS